MVYILSLYTPCYSHNDIIMHAMVLPEQISSANFYSVKITERLSVCSGVNCAVYVLVPFMMVPKLI